MIPFRSVERKFYFAWGEICKLSSLEANAFILNDYTRIYRLIDLELKQCLEPVQKEEVRSWINHSLQNLNEYHTIRKVFIYSNNLSAMKRINVSADLLKLKRKIYRTERVKRIFSYAQRVAAILIIPLLLYTAITYDKVWRNNQEKTIIKTTETKFGTQSHLVLADGTQVWLNSESKLVYPEKFAGNLREVKLTGEAYFIIKSDPAHPFYVDLEQYKVKAIGTRFSISNYIADKNFTTYLEQGTVSIIESKEGNEITLSKLEKGDLISLDRNNKLFHVSKVNGDKYLGWMEGKLVFRKDDMKEVARKLGRWFNVEVVIKDSSLCEYQFTATFQHESLKETLELLSQSSPINYEILMNDQLMDSSSGKRKVIITERKK